MCIRDRLSDMLRRLTEDGIVEYFTSNDRTVRRHARNRRVYDFGYTLPARRSSFLGQRVSAALKRTKSHRLHALPAAPYFAVNLDTAKTQSPAGQLDVYKRQIVRRSTAQLSRFCADILPAAASFGCMVRRRHASTDASPITAGLNPTSHLVKSRLQPSFRSRETAKTFLHCAP